jgi:Nif-specific regulatory protein
MEASRVVNTEVRQSRVRRTDVELFGMYEISKLLTAPERLEVILGKVIRLLSNFLDMRHGVISLLGQEGAPDVVVGSNGVGVQGVSVFEHLPERAVGQIVVTQMPLVVENVRSDPMFDGYTLTTAPDDAEISFIGVPIKESGKVAGTLTIETDRRVQAENGFDQEVRFLTMVSNLVGQTVRLHRLIVRDRERLMEERRRLEHELSGVRSEPDGSAYGIVGDSPAIRAILDKIAVVAKTHSSVLLRGESGTGKELFARAIHDLSPRADKPLIKVNCAALPESVLESELFGHEKGSFTGAQAQRKGRFELAHGGTLFLDEIGEISPPFQAKLLRVLQEGEFERVGGTTTIKVDVRLITATNKNLESAVAHGEFRADLYYRINVVPILLPPLRERPTDIALLASEFLHRFNREHGTHVEFASSGLGVLSACQFPGNVRELENCVRRTATLTPSNQIHANDFACHKDECLSSALWTDAVSTTTTPLTIGRGPRPTQPSVSPGPAGAAHPADALDSKAARSEREALVEAMEATGWVQAKAARLLGVTPRQVGYALRKHDIPIKRL